MNFFRKSPAIYTSWVVTRILIIWLGYQKVRPIQGWWADVALYNWWANNMMNGSFPINDAMWQYPPLAAPIFLIGFAINHNPIGFVLFALLADGAVLALLAFKRRQDASTKVSPLWIWVATPLIVGPIMLGRFDIFPTALTVAALVFVQRSALFGSLIAVGTMTKIWPVLTLFGTPRQSALKSVAAFLITLFGLCIVLTAWWPNAFGFISGQKARGLQIESVAALPYMWMMAMHKHVKIELQFGAIQIVAANTTWVSLVITMIGLFMFGVLAIMRLRGRLEHLTPAELTLAAVLISLVTSRVLSPQYSVWPMGILAVCAFNPPRRFLPIAALITTSCFAGSILYPGLYIQFELAQWGPLIIQTIRIFALLAATVLVWMNVWQRPMEAVTSAGEKTRNPKSKLAQPKSGR